MGGQAREAVVRPIDVHVPTACHAPTIIMANPPTPYVMPSVSDVCMSKIPRENVCHACHVCCATTSCRCGHRNTADPRPIPMSSEGMSAWTLANSYGVHCQMHCGPRPDTACHWPMGAHTRGEPTRPGESVHVSEWNARGTDRGTGVVYQNTKSTGPTVSQGERLGEYQPNKGGQFPLQAASHEQQPHAPESLGVYTAPDMAQGGPTHDGVNVGNINNISSLPSRRRRNRRKRQQRGRGQGGLGQHPEQTQLGPRGNPFPRSPLEGEPIMWGYVGPTDRKGAGWQDGGRSNRYNELGQQQPVQHNTAREQRWDVVNNPNAVQVEYVSESAGRMRTVNTQPHVTQPTRSEPGVVSSLASNQRATESMSRGRLHVNPFSSQHGVSTSRNPGAPGVHVANHNAGREQTISAPLWPGGHTSNDRR